LGVFDAELFELVDEVAYHPLLATLAGTNGVGHARMRGGNAGSARGAASLVRATISRSAMLGPPVR
jgi:hypothetical protein